MTFPWDSLRKRFRGHAERARRNTRPNRVRLSLEPLEDRLAPSASPLDPYDAWRTQPYSIDAVDTAATNQISAAATPSGSLIGLDRVFADYSYRGTGYSVAVIDTGIDYRHPALGGVWGNRVIAGWDFANNDSDPLDDNGHGTHVAGIIGSSDATYTGIAPNVNLIALKVLDASGSGTFGAVEDALKWVVANQSRYNIVAINLSLGAGNYTVNPFAYMEDEFATLNSQGVFIAAASGNSFYSFNSQQGLGYPAISPLTVAVGAVWSSNVGPVNWFNGAADYSTAADRITSFTQRSSLLDILAPGAMVTNTYLNGGFTSLSGTSMAAPAIAGAAALLHQALDATGHADQANQNGILALMKSTGTSVNDGDDENDNVINTGLNFKRLNLYAALQAITATNHAPELATIANQRMSYNQDILTLVTAASDSDGDTLTYSARTVGSTPQVQYRFSGQQLTIDPPAGYTGSFVVEVTASDGKAAATRTFSVTVDAGGNGTPLLDAIANQTMPMGPQTRVIPLSASDPNGDALTFTARTLSASSTLYQLDQQLGLSSDGNYNTNLLRLNEKWLFGNSQWYILLPSGELRRWLGTTSASLAASALVQTVATVAYTDPSLLWNAQPAPSVTYSFSGKQLNLQLQAGFVGSFVVEVSVSDGALSTSRTFTVSVNPGTTNSVPVLDRIADRNMTFGQETIVVSLPVSDPDGDALTLSARVTQGTNQLYSLKTQLGLTYSGNYNTNLLRLNEKWLRGSNSQWYIILPNGDLRRWRGTLAQTMTTSALVQKLPAQVHIDPSLLWNAASAPNVSFTFTGSTMTTRVAAGFLGSFNVEVTASDGGRTVTGSFAVQVADGSPTSSASVPLTAEQASQLIALDKKFTFGFSGSYNFNQLGLNEKWITGRNRRQFILLPNGELRQWKGTLAKTMASVIAVVDGAVYVDPIVLWNASAQPRPR